MHASIVVLSALVAVATGQYYGGWGWGGMPINPALGTPFDEPAVHMGKMFNAQQHAIRGGMAYVVRKRREAAAPEAPAAPAAAEGAEPQPEKRQLLAYSGLGYAGLGYAGWGSPYLGYGYTGYPYLFRKRRDVSEESPAAEQASMEETPKEKRQLGLWGGYGYGGLYSPYMRSIYGGYTGYPYLFRKRRDVSEGESPAAEQSSMEETPKEKRQLGYWGGYGYGGLYSPYMRSFGYGAFPYLYRKRRDTSETESPEQTPANDDQQSRDKRQYYGLGYGTWGYPSMYSGVYSPWGRSHFLWRKRRDTDSQTAEAAPAAPAAEDNTQETGREKRQFFYGAPLAYSAYASPYMMGYGLGYRGWY